MENVKTREQMLRELEEKLTYSSDDVELYDDPSLPEGVFEEALDYVEGNLIVCYDCRKRIPDYEFGGTYGRAEKRCPACQKAHEERQERLNKRREAWRDKKRGIITAEEEEAEETLNNLLTILNKADSIGGLDYREYDALHDGIHTLYNLQQKKETEEGA